MIHTVVCNAFHYRRIEGECVKVRKSITHSRTEGSTPALNRETEVQIYWSTLAGADNRTLSPRSLARFD